MRETSAVKNELDALRAEIDEVDYQIVKCFERRMELSEKIGEYKLRTGMQIFDAKREEEVLERKLALLSDPHLRSQLTELYELLMALSRRLQYGMTPLREDGGRHSYAAFREALCDLGTPKPDPLVIYSGQPGAFSETATLRFFGDKVRRQSVTSFEDVFLRLREDGDYGVLPIENSSTGSINAVYDLLGRFGCFIVGEEIVEVNQCLMAPPGATLDTVTEVFSHEQGFFQSESFLKSYPHWRLVSRSNTAESAKYVAEQNSIHMAAIAGPEAARIYGLTILGEHINFNTDNYTRFVIVSPRPEIREGSNKISVVFTLANQRGSLQRMLTIFSANGLDLMKLESRPILTRSWEYRFYADFSGNIGGLGMDSVIRELMEGSLSFKILGNYIAAGKEQT